MIVPAFADPTKDAADAKEAIGMRRKVYGAAAAREAVVLVVLEVVVFVAFAAAVGARPARLAVGALALAGLAAIVHLSATFDDEASGVTMPARSRDRHRPVPRETAAAPAACSARAGSESRPRTPPVATSRPPFQRLVASDRQAGRCCRGAPIGQRRAGR
jgi:hypothetical protein